MNITLLLRITNENPSVSQQCFYIPAAYQYPINLIILYNNQLVPV